MSGEDVLRTYRSGFQIEFCFHDAKQLTGLTHCQARHKNQLDFSYNASFASQNVAKVMMKEKRSTVFHGFFQGTHGKHIHRKINFRQVSEHAEPKVN